MTWILILFGMAGPVIVGEFATEEACGEGATAVQEMLKAEHTGDDKFHVPPIACAGIPDEFPGPADGKRI